MKKPWLGPLVALIVVWGLFAILTPDTFLREQNTISMLTKTVVVATCALGMTMIIATGGIDLSTGSIVAFTTVVIARMLRGGHSAPVAVLVALIAATAIGVLRNIIGNSPFLFKDWFLRPASRRAPRFSCAGSNDASHKAATVPPDQLQIRSSV